MNVVCISVFVCCDVYTDYSKIIVCNHSVRCYFMNYLHFDRDGTSLKLDER